MSQENPDSVKNMLLLKNPQFLPNHYETFSKWGCHEDLILTKYRNDWVKIVDFFIKPYLWVSPDSPGTHCKLNLLCINDIKINRFVFIKLKNWHISTKLNRENNWHFYSKLLINWWHYKIGTYRTQFVIYKCLFFFI